MRFMFWLGLAFVAGGLAIVITGNAGAALSVPAIIAGGVLFVLGGTMALSSHAIRKALARQAAAVQELEARGVRRSGEVVDVVPYASPAGGAVIHAEGAQLIVHIALARDLGGPERVTCHLVEDTATARARIGRPITVIQHPARPELRAIEGYLPDGRRKA